MAVMVKAICNWVALLWMVAHCLWADVSIDSAGSTGEKRLGYAGFTDALSDKQIAAIASYLRNAWKNQAADTVSAEEVKQLR